MGKLDGKIALVTGGSSGIGLATARAFIAEGAHVYVTGRRERTLEAAVRQLGPAATAVNGDVSDLADLDRLYTRIKGEKGRLDILFANAGFSEFVGIDDITEDHYSRIFSTNVKGVLFSINKALPLLSSGASIIVNGAIGASKAISHFSVYSASKAAVISLCRCIAVDLKGRGIRVNIVSPGVIPTEAYADYGMSEEDMEAFKQQLTAKIPLERTGLPEEVAKAVVFLASDDSSYVNANELFVDGGYVRV